MQGLTPVVLPETTPVGWRILEAASELFYRGGITATGMDAVVDRAGTTKRTLYQRFGSKESLVCAYLTVRAHRWQSRVLEALEHAEGASGSDAVEIVFSEAARWAADNGRGCGFVNAWAELGQEGQRVGAVIQAEKEWMRRLFRVICGDQRDGAVVHQLYEGALVCSSILRDESAFSRVGAIVGSRGTT